MTYLTPKRVIAGLLPVFFLWAFIACVSICERQSLANHDQMIDSVSVGMIDVWNVSDCRDCPLSDFPKAARSERTNIIAALEQSSDAAPLTHVEFSLYPQVFGRWKSNSQCSVNPPLKFLPTLRI